MRIGYLLQADVPDIRQHSSFGPVNHIRQVVHELRNLGHKVCLLACLDGEIWRSDDLERYDLVAAPWLDRGLPHLFERAVRWFQRQLRLPYTALFDSMRFALACCQELEDCDILYERAGWVGYGGGLAARWLGVPLVLEVNGDHLKVMEMLGIAPQGMQRRVSTILMRWAMRQASHVVTSGDGWRDDVIGRWELPPERVTAVENGTELVKLLDRQQLRSFQPDVNTGEITNLVYVGGFFPWQGVEILIRALVQVLAQGVPVRLLLVGSGPGMEAARQQVEELRIGDAVTFTGPLSAREFAPYLAKADIGVSPYCGWVEFSGLKIFDYKAAGLATIASGENGRPAVLRHGYTGWIVPPCDQDALSEAIIGLSSDVGRRRRMGQQARSEAEDCHGWEHTARELAQLFAQMIAG